MRLGLMWFAVVALAAAELPPVPDPIGLGERLALIDCLQDTYHVRPPPAATLEQLRLLYREAWNKQQPAPADTIGDNSEADQAAQRDRERRLRQHIGDRHGVHNTSTLDESALQQLLRRLDAARGAADAVDIASKVAEDRAHAAAFVPVKPQPEPTRAQPAIPPAAATPVVASTAGPHIRHLSFKAVGVSQCVLVSEGERAAVLVQFGVDHNGAFKDIPEATWACLRAAPAIRRGVLLLGHGTGGTIAGESIEAHLRTNKEFYETLGGTVPRAPVECLIFASCSASNPDQMRAMRDGFGYFPTWRVATAPRAFATRESVIAALRDVAVRPAQPAWRGLYRMGLSGDDVGAFGEVGVDGERAETSYWRLVRGNDGAWKTVEQR